MLRASELDTLAHHVNVVVVADDHGAFSIIDPYAANLHPNGLNGLRFKIELLEEDLRLSVAGAPARVVPSARQRKPSAGDGINAVPPRTVELEAASSVELPLQLVIRSDPGVIFDEPVASAHCESVEIDPAFECGVRDWFRGLYGSG